MKFRRCYNYMACTGLHIFLCIFCRNSSSNLQSILICLQCFQSLPLCLRNNENDGVMDEIGDDVQDGVDDIEDDLDPNDRKNETDQNNDGTTDQNRDNTNKNDTKNAK